MVTDENIELACRGFRKAVETYCRRCTRLSMENGKPPPSIEVLLNHVDHAIQQLTIKRKSLQLGLSHLQKTLWPQILKEFQRTNSETRQKQLLEHFLVQYLRLHDGKMLLVSGECRHKGDVITRKKTKFPSHLNKQSCRDDGYTQLYKPELFYSGYGYDEYNDSKIGIRSRLLKLLKSSSRKTKTEDEISSYLDDHGGQALDSMFDNERDEEKCLKNALNALKEQVVRDLRQLYAKTRINEKVTFDLSDKMEKLVVGKIKVERQGHAFQVLDPKGALPSGHTTQDWARTMQLPELNARTATSAPTNISNNNVTNKGKTKPAPLKKRRRIIEDDSDEENDETKFTDRPNIAKATEKCASKPHLTSEAPGSSGLSVKVTKAATPQNSGGSTSLSKIKSQLGASSRELERQREALEQEEATATKAAKKDEMEAIETTLLESETKLRSLRRILKRELARENNDLEVIWNAQELLRQQLMVVGNQILEELMVEEEESSTQNDRKEILITAHEYFKEAGALVEKQEKLRRRLNMQRHRNYPIQYVQLVSRNLLLLWGQAYTNMGIASVELAKQSPRKRHFQTVDSKRHLREAADELFKAKEYADCLRERARRDRDKLDALKADELESKVLRWWGMVLFYQGYRKEALSKFESGSSFFKKQCDTAGEKDLSNQDMFSLMCNLGAECYHSWTFAAEIVVLEMESLPMKSAVNKGEALLSEIKDVLSRSSGIRESLKIFMEANPNEELPFDEFIDQNGIMTEDSVKLYLKDLEDNWNRLKNVANRPIRVDEILPEQPKFTLQRSEVEHLFLPRLSTRKFTIPSDGLSRKRRSNRPMYHENSGKLRSALAPPTSDSTDGGETPQNSTKASRKYRPWGDELLPQILDEATGRLVPKLEYPSIAPPMPPEIKALLEAAVSTRQ